MHYCSADALSQELVDRTVPISAGKSFTPGPGANCTMIRGTWQLRQSAPYGELKVKGLKLKAYEFQQA